MLLGRDTVIFILQKFDFVINKEKACMEPSTVMELLEFILGVMTILKYMTIFLPKEKKEKIMSHSETLLNADQASHWEIVGIIGSQFIWIVDFNITNSIAKSTLLVTSDSIKSKPSAEPALRNTSVSNIRMSGQT